MDTPFREESVAEAPCIWVLAGIMDHHVCRLGYDCERCDLFRALADPTPSRGERGSAVAGSRTTHPDTRATTQLGRILAGCRVYLDRPYRPPHFWLLPVERSDGTREVRVGLDHTLMRLLSPVQRVVTPGVGLVFERDQPCGWIARSHMVVSLRMPVSGEVMESRPWSRMDPAAWEADEGGDWIFSVRPSESLEEVTGLVIGDEAAAWYADRLHVVRDSLTDALRPAGSGKLGQLLADGGAPVPSLAEVIGSSAFEALITRIARV